jgi:hypothetical protein
VLFSAYRPYWTLLRWPRATLRHGRLLLAVTA